MRKIVLPPGVEVFGQNIRAYTDNLQGEDTLPIVKKYGFVDVDPHAWYPAQALMDILFELLNRPNSSLNMVAIGMEIGKIVPTPPEMTNPQLGDVLMIWDNLYQFLHRGGDVGKIVCEKVSDTHFKTIHTDVYPDDFSYGILYGYARRFLPPGTRFTVHYDETVTPRDLGGDGPTIIHVEWE